MSKHNDPQSPSGQVFEAPAPGEATSIQLSNKVAVLMLDKQTYRVHKERLVIGSVVSADVRLAGDGVAPIHAVIEVHGGSPAEGPGLGTIYDLASDTGVFVNGAKVVTRTLHAGDEIIVGRHKLKFFVEELKLGAQKKASPEAAAPQHPASLRSSSVMESSAGRKLFVDPKEDLSPLLLEDERDVREIFDHRPAHKQALEVVMSWNSAILNVEHFVNQKPVTIGSSPKSDFGIPSLLEKDRFPLAAFTGGNYVLTVEPRQMKGVVQRKGQLLSLADVGVTQIVFEKNDFAKISVGEIDFYLSFTAAPPRLKMRRLLDKDPFFLKIFLSSMLLTAITIAGILSVEVPQTIEAEQLPERIATILYQPEKYAFKPKPPEQVVVRKQETGAVVEEPKKEKPPEKTTLNITPNPDAGNKPVPKEMEVGKQVSVAQGSKKSTAPKGAAKAQSEAKEGEGARAKGKEGTRGKQNAPKGDTPQTAANRPSPEGGEGRGSGNSQVADEGNVDVLKGASDKILSLLGNSAAQLGKGGSKLQGFGGFDTRGQGGLALSGDGKGGGGTADSLGGLGEKGKGGGRVGTGLGAAGQGNEIVGGRARVVIRSGGAEEAVVMGAIDADAVEAALLAHKDEFRLCYEREINAETPKLAGRVGTSFVIGTSGRITQAGIESTTLRNANTERCVLNVIRRIQFPIPRGGGIVQVTYPFKFNSLR